MESLGRPECSCPVFLSFASSLAPFPPHSAMVSVLGPPPLVPLAVGVLVQSQPCFSPWVVSRREISLPPLIEGGGAQGPPCTKVCSSRAMTHHCSTWFLWSQLEQASERVGSVPLGWSDTPVAGAVFCRACNPNWGLLTVAFGYNFGGLWWPVAITSNIVQKRKERL